MTKENKVAIIGTILGVGVFLLFHHFFWEKKDAGPKKELVNDEPKHGDIKVALAAFKDAVENNEDALTISELNKTFKKDFKITVEYDRSTGKYSVRNKKGDIIKTV